MNGIKESNTTETTVEKILSKLGTVLSKTKDALLKDFLQDMESYLPQLTDEGNYTYENFKNNLKPGETPIGKFIETLFTRLGYDISSFEANKELTDIVKAIIAATISLSEAIKELSDSKTDWMSLAQEFMEETQSSEYKKNIVNAAEFYDDPDLNSITGLSYTGNNFALELDFGEGSGKISAIIHLVLDLISIIKKFRNIESAKLQKEFEDFGEFLDTTYFNKQFAERILDHILVVLLNNAKEVFADDIDAILDNLDKVKNDIKEEIGKSADEIIEQIKALRKEIEALEKKIQEETKKLVDEAKEAGREVVKEISTELQVQYKIAKSKLEKLINEALGSYNQIGTIFNRIHAVLDFLKVIDTRTIEIAKYIPNSPAIPQINLGEVNNLINKANNVVGDTNKTIQEINKEIKNSVDSLKSMCPTVDIYVIEWKKLENIFTNPIDYIKSIYSINDYDDAEKLLSEILDVVRAFNDDIPDFNSIKELLYELLIRVREKIKDEISPLTTEVKRTFAKFESFITDLLKVLEKFAVGIKNELKSAFSDFEKDKDSLIKQLKSSINDSLAELKDFDGKIKNFKLPDTNIKFKKINGLNLNSNQNQIKDLLKKAFADPFIKTIGEKASEHEIFKHIKPDDWKNLIEKSISENLDKNIIKEYKTILNEVEVYITDIFSANNWEKKFNSIISELKDEFELQTKDVPDNFDKIKDYCKGSVENLLTGTRPANPFSNFYFNTYLTILSDKIKELVPDTPELYYIKFREATILSMESLLSAKNALSDSFNNEIAKIAKEEYNKKLKAFITDVFAEYWTELKNSIYKNLIRPFVTVIEKSVKDWTINVLIPEVIEFVTDNIINELNFNEYKEIFNEVEEFADDVKKAYDEAKETAEQIKEKAKDAVELIKRILLLSEEAKDINSWSDGLKFAINLYKAIPPTIKTYLRELIDMPNWDLDNIHLPDYKLDTKNKFLAVTLYEYPGKDEVKSDNFSADISFMLVAFVGDRKVRDDKNEVVKDEDGDDVVESGLYFFPVFRGKFGVDFNLSKKHYLSIAADTSLNPDLKEKSKNNGTIQKDLEEDILGFFFKAGEDDFSITAQPLSNLKAISAYLELLFQRGQKDKKEVKELEIFKSELAELTIKNYPQKLFLGYSEGNFDVGYLGELQNLILTLRLHTLNNFFATILNNDIKIELEKLGLGYSLKDGFLINGQYNIQIPLNTDIDLKAVKFRNINLELGSGELKNILTSFKTNFVADFKGIAFSFSDMGLGIDFNYMTPDGRFGDFDFSPKFFFPDGLAISINTKAVKGAGLVRWNKQKEEFLGALELSILDMCSAGALVLFNMKMPDGSKGFSFMGAISVFFTPGIQIGMGFSLTGIGGSLGINRRIDTEMLRDAVTDGSLSSILFVKDLHKNLDIVLANSAKYYPIKKDQIFFGFLAQITWGEVLKVELGLFVQAPDPVIIAIAGAIKVNISESLEKLLSLNVYFWGVIDFSKGLSFDASLVNSHIVGIDMYGDMALRIYWAGDTKGFILSAGGFHPNYKPEAGFNLGSMRRIGMKLDYKILKLSLESYFAITSNTVQFGADMRLQIGWDKFGISGYLYFNTLFQFNPFMFMFDIGAGVSVNIGTLKLLTINLALELSGPAPWNANGKASFWFLFIKISVDFNHTWGKKQAVSERKYIDVLPLYFDNFIENSNWQTISNDLTDNMVNYAKIEGDELVMQPSDLISFNQSAVPMNIKLERYGEAFPNDIEKFKISNVKISDYDVEYKINQSSFAPTLITKLSDKEKLSVPSYKNMDAGFTLKTGFGEEKPEGTEVKSEIEKKCQDIKSIWNEWENYSKNIEITKPKPEPELKIAKPMRAVRPEKPLRYTRRASDSYRVSVKKSRVTMSRASSRKKGEGLKRYTREMDNNLSRKMDKYIELL